MKRESGVKGYMVLLHVRHACIFDRGHHHLSHYNHRRNNFQLSPKKAHYFPALCIEGGVHLSRSQACHLEHGHATEDGDKSGDAPDGHTSVQVAQGTVVVTVERGR